MATQSQEKIASANAGAGPEAEAAAPTRGPAPVPPPGPIPAPDPDTALCLQCGSKTPLTPGHKPTLATLYATAAAVAKGSCPLALEDGRPVDQPVWIGCMEFTAGDWQTVRLTWCGPGVFGLVIGDGPDAREAVPVTTSFEPLAVAFEVRDSSGAKLFDLVVTP